MHVCLGIRILLLAATSIPGITVDNIMVSKPALLARSRRRVLLLANKSRGGHL